MSQPQPQPQYYTSEATNVVAEPANSQQAPIKMAAKESASQPMSLSVAESVELPPAVDVRAISAEMGRERVCFFCSDYMVPFATCVQKESKRETNVLDMELELEPEKTPKRKAPEVCV